MSTGVALKRRPLPPEVATRIREVVEEFSRKLEDCLEQALRFYGMEPLDAMLDVIDERGSPVPYEELVSILKAGGLAMTDASESHGGPEGDLRRSVSFYTSREFKIKRINNQVGRKEWPEKIFQMSGKKGKK